MKLLAPFALLIIALTAVVRLDDTPTDADLIFVNQNEVFTLDPQRMSYLQDLRLAHVLYEGLVRWDNTDFTILPAAAGLPEVSADGLTYTFTIRPDATWSNGHPVTAYDFIYSWQRAILPDTAADYSNMFFLIDGAEAFFDWRAKQTARFVTDPWSGEATADAGATLSLIARLEALLDADDLPGGIAMIAPGERDAVRHELTRLVEAAGEAADEGGLPLRAALADAILARAWHERLDDESSRETEGAWMWATADRRFAETVGLRARGDRTLEVRLARPTAFFLDLLCFGVFSPVHRPTVEGWPDGWSSVAGWHASDPPPMTDRRWLALGATTGRINQRHEWAKPGRHVGNGTHLLAQWRYKRDLRLEPNPGYHDADQVTMGAIVVRTIEDTNTAVLAFESGHVDWLADVSTEYQSDMIDQQRAYVERHRTQMDALLAEGFSGDEALALLPPPRSGERRNIHVFPTFGTEFFSFNCRPALSDGRPNPFAHAAVRRAFVMSVDKQTIVDRVTRLHEPVTRTLIPPGSIPGYVGPEGLPFDPDRARAEFAAAGWSDKDGDGMPEDSRGRPFPVIDLLYTTNIPRYKWISLNLKSQWEQELGVRIELRGVETKFYKEDLKQGQFMIARGRWYGDYGDPTTFLDLCRSTDGNNDRKYNNPEIDALLDRAAVERDPEERMRLLAECERILFDEEVPMLVLCQLVQVYMYEPGRVIGLSDHPRLTQYLWQMQVNKE